MSHNKKRIVFIRIVTSVGCGCYFPFIWRHCSQDSQFSKTDLNNWKKPRQQKLPSQSYPTQLQANQLRHRLPQTIPRHHHNPHRHPTSPQIQQLNAMHQQQLQANCLPNAFPRVPSPQLVRASPTMSPNLLPNRPRKLSALSQKSLYNPFFLGIILM